MTSTEFQSIVTFISLRRHGGLRGLEMERVKTKLKWDTRPEWFKLAVTLGIVFGATFAGYGLFMVAMGTTSPLVVVTSYSMVPTLDRGDLLVLQAKPPDQIKVGDIIVFQDKEWVVSGPVVHRVVDIQVINGTYHFYTKGDANAQQDPYDRTPDEIIGVVVYRIPYVGNISLFLRTPTGMVTIVLLFIAILVIPEFVCSEEEEEEAEEQDTEDSSAEDPDSTQSGA